MSSSKVAAWEGSSFRIEVLKLTDVEDSSRNVIGTSAARKCKHVSVLCASILAEDPEKKDADACAAVFREKKCDAAWGAETIRRYQAVGKRLRNETLSELLTLSEFHFGRGVLLDSLTNVRGVFSVCADDEQVHGPYRTRVGVVRAGPGRGGRQAIHNRRD